MINKPVTSSEPMLRWLLLATPDSLSHSLLSVPLHLRLQLVHPSNVRARYVIRPNMSNSKILQCTNRNFMPETIYLIFQGKVDGS